MSNPGYGVNPTYCREAQIGARGIRTWEGDQLLVGQPYPEATVVVDVIKMLPFGLCLVRDENGRTFIADQSELFGDGGG